MAIDSNNKYYFLHLLQLIVIMYWSTRSNLTNYTQIIAVYSPGINLFKCWQILELFASKSENEPESFWLNF